MGLFKPAWKSKNPDRRLKWIFRNEYSVNPEHLKIFDYLAKNDSVSNVQEMANNCHEINLMRSDGMSYVEIAKSKNMDFWRTGHISKLIKNQEDSKKIQEDFKDIVFNAESTEARLYVLLYCLKFDKKLFEGIAKWNDSDKVRSVAMRELKDF